MKNFRFTVMISTLVLIVFATMMLMRSYNPAKKPLTIDGENIEEISEVKHLLGEAYTLYNNKDYNGAEKRLTLLLNLEPSNINALQLLGKTYFDAGKYQEAAETFHAISTLMPNSAQTFNNLGTSLLLCKKYPDAIIALKKSISIEPGHSQPHLNLAEIYLKLNQKKAAISELKKAIDIESKKNSIIINLNRFNELKNEKEYQEMIKTYKAGDSVI